MARALETDVDQLGDLDTGRSDLTLSSMCTVFAESEVVSLIADGTQVADIVSALHRSIATRTMALVKRVCNPIDGRSIAMSGGVAHNQGVVKTLGNMLHCAIKVPDQPDTVGALGAALIARQRASDA
jgi:activator of 2-hydroxyglutaryl-CoA dehydratase